MEETVLKGLKHLHFIGVGGIGMSGLAYVLAKQGYIISGSDVQNSAIAEELSHNGVTVFIGHAACQIEGAEALVVSSAIKENNPELLEARRRKIPVLHRSDILAHILNTHGKSVAVAGAHGKTTTSSMLALAALECALEPTVIVGGVISNIGSNAVQGNSELVIAEADESDGSFLKFHPALSVVTNIENDHLDHYGTEEKIKEAFAQFVANLRPEGTAVLCFDNEKVRSIAPQVRGKVVSYGIDATDADFVGRNLKFSQGKSTCSVYRRGLYYCSLELTVPGRHNVLNAIGTLAAAYVLGMPLDRVLASLKHFSGAKRRFETKYKDASYWIVDDYAHHPTEIKATLQAARQTEPKRLICIFQPHRYTRTKLLWEEFATAFTQCDELIVTDIYAASEAPISGISGKFLAEKIVQATGQKLIFKSGMKEIIDYVRLIAHPGDLIVTMGAGNVYCVGEELARLWEEEKKSAGQRV